MTNVQLTRSTAQGDQETRWQGMIIFYVGRNPTQPSTIVALARSADLRVRIRITIGTP